MNRPAKPDKPECIIEGCTHVSMCRGLCHSCYMAARHQVKSGNYTWEQLQDLGLSARARNNNQWVRGPFALALKAATDNKDTTP